MLGFWFWKKSIFLTCLLLFYDIKFLFLNAIQSKTNFIQLFKFLNKHVMFGAIDNNKKVIELFKHYELCKKMMSWRVQVPAVNINCWDGTWCMTNELNHISQLMAQSLQFRHSGFFFIAYHYNVTWESHPYNVVVPWCIRYVFGVGDRFFVVTLRLKSRTVCTVGSSCWLFCLHENILE